MRNLNRETRSNWNIPIWRMTWAKQLPSFPLILPKWAEVLTEVRFTIESIVFKLLKRN